MRVQAENGAILEFPDDADEAEIDAGVNEYLSEQAAQKPTLATKIESKDPTIEDRAGAALLGAGQGASFGFGEEALAGLTTAGTLPITGAITAANKLGADIPNPMADKSIEDVYNEQLGANRAQLTKAAEGTPVEYIGGNIAGAIGGGIGTAGTKGATMLANSLRSGNLAARISKGALAGAASGGVYGFGAGEGDAEKRLESAGDAALVGGVVGGAAPVVASVAKNVAKGAQRTAQGAVARGVDELEAATQAMRQESSANYAAMRQANAFINKPRAINIANKAEAAMNSVGKINKRLHGDTLSVLGDFKKAINSNNTTIEELDQFRQLFGQVVTKNTSKLDGANPDALMARKIIESIDDSVDNLSPIDIKGGSTKAVDSLLKARAGYAKMKKFDSVARIIRDSEGDANYVKRELNKFIKDARKTRGWTEDELAALDEAGKLGAGEAVLKVLGKFGFDPSRIGSGVGAMFGSGAGAVMGGTAGGVAVPAVGTAARYAQKGLVRGQAENLLKTIEGGVGKSAKLPPVNLPVTQASGAIGVSPVQPLKITIRPNLKTTIKNLAKDESGSVGGVNKDALEHLNDFRVKKGVTLPKSQSAVYRGVSETTGDNMAAYGQGLYVTPNKKFASEYGKLQEIPLDELPKNALRFDTINDFQIWAQQLAKKTTGSSSVNEAMRQQGDLGKWIQSIYPDIDGMQIGKPSMNNMEIVKWPTTNSSADIRAMQAPLTAGAIGAAAYGMGVGNAKAEKPTLKTKIKKKD